MWRVTSVKAVSGEGLGPASRLDVASAESVPARGHPWRLTGVPSYVRYVEVPERAELRARQAPLGRAEATCAALIPITKSAAWWELAQDERRAIFEERSKHISASLKYLPAIARQLYHCRELGEPFDFLTWFEFAPEHSGMFDELVAMLRGTEEWRYVVREVDVRLGREGPSAPVGRAGELQD